MMRKARYTHDTDWQRRAGMTLLETLGVCVIILICFNVCMKLFVTNFRLASLGHTVLEQLEQLEANETLFRETVRPAVGFAETAGTYRAGNDCLILRYPPINGQARYMVVGALDTDDRLCRMELLEQGGEWELLDFRSFPAPVETFTFSTPELAAGRAQAWLTFTLKKASPNRFQSTDHVVQVTLRGQEI